MTDTTRETHRRALAMLSALRKNVDTIQGAVEEKYVTEFHAALDSLEATGIDVSQFRIPDSEVKPIVFRPINTLHFRGQRPSRPTYSEESYVDKPLLLTKLDAAIESMMMLSPDAEIDSFVTIERIFSRFHQVARQLRARYASRDTLDVGDEYDVQDLLHALLRLYFDDIRPEECTPTYAGGSSKMDFLLKDAQVVIEVKKTRERLGDREIGRQLIEDIAKYKEHHDCRTLACFVYDPEGRLGNPIGLENDLAKFSTDDVNVKVFIFPK